jgi:hypothetical protein
MVAGFGFDFDSVMRDWRQVDALETGKWKARGVDVDAGLLERDMIQHWRS